MPPCDQAELSLDLDEKLYSLEAAQNAAYVFTDRAYVTVERSAPDRLKVVLAAKEGSSVSPAALKGEFGNELIHQVLRQRISDSNQKIREFIVTKALLSAQPASASASAAAAATAEAEASCPDCTGAGEAPAAPPQIDAALEKEIDRLLAEIESGDGAADPLGVSVPWEEAHGAKAKEPAALEAPKAPAKAAPQKAPAKAAKAKPAAKGKRK